MVLRDSSCKCWAWAWAWAVPPPPPTPILGVLLGSCVHVALQTPTPTRIPYTEYRTALIKISPSQSSGI